MKIFLRTVKIAVITTAFCMAGGIPTAYFISRCPKKYRGLLLALSIFPMMTNSVIRSFAWINILGSNGIVNKFLLAAGFVDKPAKLLYTDFAIIIGSIYLFLPLMIVTVTGVMENIDDDMMEAAQSLGAARMEAFMKVIFPMSLPGIIVGGILVFTGTHAPASGRQQQHGDGYPDIPEGHVRGRLDRGVCNRIHNDHSYTGRHQGL